MDRLRVSRGRFIPSATATDADRLRMLEVFIAKYSEENECSVNVLEDAIAELQATVSTLQATVRMMTVTVTGEVGG